jgi:hypothetical protein
MLTTQVKDQREVAMRKRDQESNIQICLTNSIENISCGTYSN